MTKTLIPDRLAALESAQLFKGSHLPPLPHESPLMCMMEAVAWVSGEDWSDHPKCVSPLLGAYGRVLNDVLSPQDRQKLLRYVPAIVGTADDGHDDERVALCLEWVIGDCLPRWLDRSGHPDLAAQTRGTQLLGLDRWALHLTMIADQLPKGDISTGWGQIYLQPPPMGTPAAGLFHVAAAAAMCGAGAGAWPADPNLVRIRNAVNGLGVRAMNAVILNDQPFGSLMATCHTELIDLFPVLIDPDGHF